jgi:hypothetical protein
MPYQVRPLGVLLAAVATFAVGMLWYSPLVFGKAWMRLNGYTPERMVEMRRKVGRAYLVSFIAYLVLAFGLDSVAGAGSPIDAIKISVRVWLFFVLPVSVTALMFWRFSRSSPMPGTRSCISLYGWSSSWADASMDTTGLMARLRAEFIVLSDQGDVWLPAAELGA